MGAPRDDIRTVKEARRLTVRLGEDAFGEEALISTCNIGRFRAVRTPEGGRRPPARSQWWAPCHCRRL